MLKEQAIINVCTYPREQPSAAHIILAVRKEYGLDTTANYIYRTEWRYRLGRDNEKYKGGFGYAKDQTHPNRRHIFYPNDTRVDFFSTVEAVGGMDACEDHIDARIQGLQGNAKMIMDNTENPTALEWAEMAMEALRQGEDYIIRAKKAMGRRKSG
jgi:hypothetical protein